MASSGFWKRVLDPIKKRILGMTTKVDNVFCKRGERFEVRLRSGEPSTSRTAGCAWDEKEREYALKVPPLGRGKILGCARRNDSLQGKGCSRMKKVEKTTDYLWGGGIDGELLQKVRKEGAAQKDTFSIIIGKRE